MDATIFSISLVILSGPHALFDLSDSMACFISFSVIGKSSISFHFQAAPVHSEGFHALCQGNADLNFQNVT